MGRKRKEEKREKAYIEHYNVAKLLYLMDNSSKLNLDMSAYDDLINRLECTEQSWPYGKQSVTYHGNAINIGRIMPDNLAFISMKKVIRHTISDHLYADIDFVNCHPNIVLCLCVGQNTKCLKRYIDEREEVFTECLLLNKNKVKEDMKKWFLKAINGGGFEEDIQLTQFMEDFRAEMNILHGFIYDSFQHREEYCMVKAFILEKEGPRTENIKVKVVSYILQDYENRMREVLSEFFENQGIDWSVNCFDGGMSYLPRNEKDIFQISLDQAMFQVAAKTNIQCNIKISLLNQVIPISSQELERYDHKKYIVVKNKYGKDYLSMKSRFEINNFFIFQDVTYYTEDNYVVKGYSKMEFLTKYEHLNYIGLDKKGNTKTISFISEWMKDETKRAFQSIVFHPPGAIQNEEIDSTSVYLKWKGFFASHIVPDGKNYSDEVRLIRNHTAYLCSHNAKFIEYVEKYLAYILRNPGRKTDIILAFKAVQGGEGKNTFWEIFAKVLGPSYCASTQSHERDWFGDFNELIADKIWLHMEEMSKETVRKYQKQLLSFITSKTDVINFKHGRKRVVPSFCNYMISFNVQGLDTFPGLKRRLWVHELAKEQVPPPEYFDTLYELINNNQVIRAYYDYLLSLDITHFHPASSHCKPETPYMTKLFGMRDKFDQFMIDKTIEWYNGNLTTLKVLNKDLYAMYCERQKMEGHLAWAMSVQKFSAKMLESFPKALKSGHEKGVLYYNIEVMKLVHHYVISEDIKHEELGFEDTLGKDMYVHCVRPCFGQCDTPDLKNICTTQTKRFYTRWVDLGREPYDLTCSCNSLYSLSKV